MGGDDEIELTEVKGQLTKVIMKEGNGDHPPPGVTVKVHYIGTLENGEQFDSSVARGRPFFIGRTGMGHVPYSRRVALAVAALCGAAAQCPAECQHAVPCGLPMCGPHCCAFYGKRRQPTK